jgi:hypothetical protein
MVRIGRRESHWRAYVAVGLVTVLLGPGQAQAQHKTNRAADITSPANSYQRGTDAAPVVVEVQGADTPPQRAAAHTEDVKRHDLDQRWAIGIGIASVVAAIFQAAIFVGQIIYLRRTVLDSEKAIAAATRAADAATRQADVTENTAKRQLRAYLSSRPDYLFRFNV